MKLVNMDTFECKTDGTKSVRALLLSSTAITTPPTTGAGIEGLNSTDTFAPMSIIYVTANVTNKVWIADETGTFIAQ